MKKIINEEKEQTKLTLRKNKLFNIISSKRKLNFQNETDPIIEQEYLIHLNDFSVPEELKINLTKFFQNVIKTNL